MFRIDGPTAAPGGLFTGGDPAVPTPPTVVSPEWLSSVQEEIVGVVLGAGLTLSKANRGQLFAAIQTLITSGGVSFASDAEAIAGALANKAVSPHAAAALVATRVAAVVGAAPAGLDTLVELAAAIGNNPNFASDVTQALAARALASLQINVDGLVSGGGALNGDVTLTVAAASGAELNAGTEPAKALTPAGYAAAGGGDWQNGWAPAPGGRIEQWGSVVVIGDNTSARQFTVSFPRPFIEGCGSIVGNSEPFLTGQGQWHPMTVNFTAPSIAGATGFVDATDSSKKWASGKRVWWRAIGR